MLALLSLIAAFKTHIVLDKPSNPDACFTLKYAKSESINESMTPNDEGYFVALRIYDSDGNPGEVHLLRWKDNHINPNDQVWLELKRSERDEIYDPVTGNLQVKLFLKNRRYHDNMTVDVGVFADASFFNNDNATVKLSKDKRSFIVESRYYAHTILLKGSYFPDVSSIYFGNLPNSGSLDPKDYPYFNDDTNTTTSSQDSVYAFAWQKLFLNPWEETTLGFIVAPGDVIRMPPFIFLKTEIQPVYQINSEVILYFDVIDHDPDETVTVVADINGQHYEESFSTSEDNKLQTFRYPAKMDKPEVSYSIHAKDSQGYLSKTIEGQLFSDGHKRPKLTLKFQHPFEFLTTYFELGQEIELEGTVEDEYFVTLYYEVNFIQHRLRTIYIENGVRQDFKIKFKFPEYVTTGGYRETKFYVVDSLGITSSEPIYPEIFIRPPTKPRLFSAYLSDQRIAKGDSEIIVAEAGAPKGKNYTIYATWDQKPETKTPIGEFEGDNNMHGYANLFQIPENATPGRHNITIEVEGADSSDAQILYVIVHDPENPIESQPGNITEVKLTKNTNACFNLNYIDHDKKAHGMSHNDEGFYVGYRLYNENRPGPTQLVTSKNNQRSTTDEITVQYKSKYEIITGFFQAIFEVSNSGFFPKTIDLGVFVDSEFGNRHDFVTVREDGRGVTVINDDPYIRYTVFTRNYGYFPSVSGTYMRSVDRTNDQEIAAADIPFFESAPDIESSGDTMYSFSWDRVQVPPNATIELGVTFVPNDVMKTPPTLIELTDKQDYYNKNQDVELKFKLIDADIGETVNIVYILNVSFFELQMMPINITDPNGQEFSININTGDGPYYDYMIWASDPLLYVSNLIQGRLPNTQRPSLYLDDTKFKKVYFEGHDIEIAGEVSDEGITYIRYQYDDSVVLTAGKVDATGSDDWNGVKFSFSVTIPPQVKPGQHTLYVWVEDEWGVHELLRSSHNFDLHTYTPPILRRAGLSHRIAKAGTKLLGYVAFEDADTGKSNSVKVYMPTMDGFEVVKTAIKSAERKPWAFYWTIPHGTPANTYDVVIQMEDHDGLTSQNKTITLLVTD